MAPRIRTLKPDHRQHRKVGPLSHVVYRLWVGMIVEADDEGRLVADPGQLRVLIFGYHPDVTREEIDTGLATLATYGLIQRYTVAATPYACFPSWKDHQRIKKPTPSRLPPPPLVENSSPTPSPPLPHSSRKSALEGKGREGKGKEYSLERADTPQFEQFWKAYPRKIGKASARRVWMKVGQGNGFLARTLVALAAQVQSEQWRREGGRFIPHPATWLNQGRWDDEVAPGASEEEPYGVER